jgi:molybdate transport system substrate-binding protein
MPDWNPMRYLSIMLAMMGLLVSALPGLAGEKVHVFAAASTRDGLEDAIARFHREMPEAAQVVGVYGGSSTLARQIIAGAPAHLFLSANTSWMDQVLSSGLGSSVGAELYLGNRLVLVASRQARGTRFADGRGLLAAIGAGPLAIADPRAVPAGIYARQTLETLGIWEQIRRSLAPTENVRGALALVQRGEAHYGFVYATDATIGRVRVVWTVPAGMHDPIVYPLALLGAGEASPTAVAFHRFLVSEDGRAAFRERGFTEPEL